MSNTIIRALISVFLSFMCWGCGAERSENKKNVVFILADDLGWRDTSVYGSTFYETPNLQRLADSGVTFFNAYAANPLCSPTRASILTGQYPGRLRFTAASGHLGEEILDPVVRETARIWSKATNPESRTRLPNNYLTIAEALKDENYKTAFLGKWHLGPPPYSPENQGFDFVVAGREWPGPPSYFAPWSTSVLPKAPPGTHIGDLLTNKALKFMKRHRKKPFFVALWFFNVHGPFETKPEAREKYLAKVDPSNPQRSPTMAGMIDVMDANIGRLLGFLEEEGLADDTIIIFASDNGGNMYNVVDGFFPTSNAPLRAGKGNNYEGGVRVPLIVRWPGAGLKGAKSDAIVSSVDFFPTILEMIEAPLRPQDHVDGVSFTDAVIGRPHDRGPTFSHFPHSVPAPDSVANISVRQGPWKLYRFFHDGPDQQHRYELYNLDTDISETTNLADVQLDKTQELDGLISAHLDESGALQPLKNPRYFAPSFDGWKAKKIVNPSIHNGSLLVTSLDRDPQLVTERLPMFDDPFVVAIEMSSQSSGPGAVFWWAKGDGVKRAQKIDFQPIHDGESHSYKVEVPLKGRLTRLRIDPASGAGDIAINTIHVESAEGSVIRRWDFDE